MLYVYLEYEIRDWFRVLKRRYYKTVYGKIEADSEPGNQEIDKPWWIPTTSERVDWYEFLRAALMVNPIMMYYVYSGFSHAL
jgi:hypothetical protein